jgi:hypothetical protein
MGPRRYLARTGRSSRSSWAHQSIEPNFPSGNLATILDSAAENSRVAVSDRLTIFDHFYERLANVLRISESKKLSLFRDESE